MTELSKIALVTGASRGIGRGVALVLAKEGYDLAITYASHKDQADETADYIRKTYGRKCVAIQAQLDQAEVPAQLAETVWQELGRVDVLVNNAGATIFGNILTMDLEKINYLMNLDFRGYILLAQAVAKRMVKDGIKGSIINITSTRGSRAYRGDAVYGGVKAALARATQSMALDLAPYGIRVNCVAPGATATKHRPGIDRVYDYIAAKVPLKRIGTPEDIGQAVAWFASDKASYVTGQLLHVDGGLILPGPAEKPEEE